MTIDQGTLVQGNILVVDDTRDDLRLLVRILDKKGYIVRPALDGVSALMGAQAEPPDLILLDINMPHPDGYAVCQQLKAIAHTRDIPVIFISALDKVFDKVRAFRVGGIDYITKPIQAEEVLARVETHLSLYSMRQQLQAQNTVLQQEIIERKRAENALRRAHDELEERVMERTAELARANVSLKAEIAERKRVEKDREQLITILERQNAELERFAYTISHELKSPMVTITGFVGLVKQDALRGDTTRLTHDLERIRSAIDQMYQTLRDLLELSRIGRVVNPSEAVPFSELVQEVVDRMADRLEVQKVQVRTIPEFPVVWGDRPRLLEVLHNLLENAVKFLGDQPQPVIEIGVKQRDDEAVFYVADNGIGIEPRYHEKVFGLFERLESSIEGTGVGLALVKRIIELHGGRIWVESEGQGHGSTFYFTLSQNSSKGIADD